MTEDRQPPLLSSDLDYWEITLKTGEIISARAHAFGEEGNDLVFVVLMTGDPPYEYEVLRLPSAIVHDVEGGWTSPRSPSDRAD